MSGPWRTPSLRMEVSARVSSPPPRRCGSTADAFYLAERAGDHQGFRMLADLEEAGLRVKGAPAGEAPTVPDMIKAPFGQDAARGRAFRPRPPAPFQRLFDTSRSWVALRIWNDPCPSVLRESKSTQGGGR
jgi:hypothetical protein